MSVIVFFVTQVVKIPVKKLTTAIKEKYNLSDRGRRLINLVILVIPFLIGLFAEFLYACCYLKTSFNVYEGLLAGIGGISLYAFIDQTGIGKKKEESTNPYTDTEEGKALVDLVENITADGKVDEQDVDAVKAFFDFIKKDEK